MTDDRNAPPPGTANGSDPVSVSKALLVPELAEVLLLLDNVSGVPGKTLPDLDNTPPFDKEATGWLDQICMIRLPPKPDTPEVRANYAAKLLKAKDELTRHARPATSASIAFCLMLAGGDPPIADRAQASDQQPLSRIDRMRRSLASRLWPPPEAVRQVETWDDRLGDNCSLETFARTAFPAIARNMGWSRGLNTLLNFLLVVALISTCWLSWQVATGVALLNQVDAIGREELLVKTAVSRAALGMRASTSSGAGVPIGNTTEPAANGQGAPGTAAEQAAAAALDMASKRLSERDGRPAAVANLMRWVEDNWLLAAIIGGRSQASVYRSDGEKCLTAPNDRSCPVYSPSPVNSDGSPIVLRDPNVQWASVLISVLAVSVLPILYGFLGSATAVVRRIASRMQDDVLVPRDLPLGLTQLALGAVVGACIGLFIGPDGGGEPNGLFGAVSLSEAALCFLAGFGVDGVFRALEQTLARAFPDPRTDPLAANWRQTSTPPRPPPSAPPPPPPPPSPPLDGLADAKQPHAPQE